MKKKKPSSVAKQAASSPPIPARTFSAIMGELKSIRRDFVLLTQIIVDGQKVQRHALKQQLQHLAKADAHPGMLNANILAPSFFDPIFEDEQERAGG